MGLRQSKRSVDISGSPKKEFPAAAVVEKIPEANHGTEVEKVDEIIKPSTNGDTKLTETPELNKSDAEDAKEITVTEVTADIKADETMSPPKDEKKEKVKKKRSFRSFSFLRREKKNKEENNKNGEVAKEPKVENVDIVEQTEVAPVAVPEACTNTEEAAPAAVEPVEELPSTKENEVVVEEQTIVADAPSDESLVKEKVEEKTEETPVAETEQETAQNVEIATESGNAEQSPITPEATVEELVADEPAVEDVAQPIVEAEPIQETEKKVEVTSEESQVVQTSEE